MNFKKLVRLVQLVLDLKKSLKEIHWEKISKLRTKWTKWTNGVCWCSGLVSAFHRSLHTPL